MRMGISPMELSGRITTRRLREGNALRGFHFRAQVAEVRSQIGLARAARGAAAAGAARRATAATRAAAAIGLVAAGVLVSLRRGRRRKVFEPDRQAKMFFESLCELFRIGVFTDK